MIHELKQLTKKCSESHPFHIDSHLNEFNGLARARVRCNFVAILCIGMYFRYIRRESVAHGMPLTLKRPPYLYASKLSNLICAREQPDTILI